MIEEAKSPYLDVPDPPIDSGFDSIHMERDVEETNGYDDAGFLGKMIWTFSFGLLRRGYKRQLNINDLHRLSEKDYTEVHSHQVKACWDAEVNRCRALNEARVRAAVEASTQSEGEVEVFIERPSMFKVFMHIYGWKYFMIGFQGLCEFQSQLAAVYCMSLLLDYISEAESHVYTYERYAGYLFAVGVALCTMLTLLFHHQYFFHAPRVGVNARNAVMHMIYRHSISLRPVDLVNFSSGFAVSVMANDPFRLQEIAVFQSFLWTPLMNGAVGFFLIYEKIGLYFLFGFGVQALMLVMQFVFSIQFSRVRKIIVGAADTRIKAVQELLNGAEIIKMYCWERPVLDRVMDAREREMTGLRRYMRLRGINLGLYSCVFVTVSMVTWLSWIETGKELDSTKIFTVISFFSVVAYPITQYIPYAVELLASLMVSCSRFEEILLIGTNYRGFTPSEESEKSDSSGDSKGDHEKMASFSVDAVKAEMVDAETKMQADQEQLMAVDSAVPRGAVLLKNASFSWSSKSSRCLGPLTVSIKPGELVGVAGSVASFKSSFLQALLGEMPVVGTISGGVGGKMSYAPQRPWLTVGSVRDNITMGHSVSFDRYAETLYACSLGRDIEMLPQRDRTVIAEQGANLSGGQRARVALARTVLSPEADVFLLDDVFSAVDALVADHIFREAVGPHSLLSGKTRILVTHNEGLLKQCDRVLVLEKGKIIADGPFTAVQSIVAAVEEETLEEGDVSLLPVPQKTPRASQMTLEQVKAVQRLPPPAASAGISEESRRSGGISFAIFKMFLQSANPWLIPVTFLLFVLSVALKIAADSWLSNWSKATYEDQKQPHRRNIYIFLCLGAMLSAFLSPLVSLVQFLNNANNLHSKMMDGVQYTDMSFFHTNPVGRVQNRFSKDLETLSATLPPILFDTIQTTVACAGAMVVMCMIVPYMTIVMVLLIPLFVACRQMYIPASRDIKRLDAVTRSPILSLFSTSLAGLPVIRAFGLGQSFESMFVRLIDIQSRTFYGSEYIARWLSFRLDFICVILSLGTGLFGVAMRESMNPADIGFALSYLLNVATFFQWMTRQTAECENMLTCAERILEYSELKKEGVISAECNISVCEHHRENNFDKVTEWPCPGFTDTFVSGITHESDVDLVNMESRCISAEEIRAELQQGQPSVLIELETATSELAALQARAQNEMRENVLRSTEGLEPLLTDTVSQMESATERLLAVQPTCARHRGNGKAPIGWPWAGAIQLSQVVMAYRPGLPLVLRGLTVSIKAGERVGICGRTGCGKSSLLKCQYRQVDPFYGSITIDGIDVGALALHELRRVIGVIPQTPVVFSGTLRYNLDPFTQHTDQDILTALEHSYLSSLAQTPAGLTLPLQEGGSNLSAGEAQLLCFARALLGSFSILILDECTANVDRHTDELIQKLIRTQLGRRTTLTVAHRLDTIVDYDRIVVLDGGVVVEQGSPQKLLQNKESYFSVMYTAQQAGEHI